MGKRGEGKVKDPNAPKRAKSSFIFFSCEYREVIKKEDPGLKITEVTKLLGLRWHALTDAQKQPFKDMQEEDKQRYEREKAQYVPPPNLPKAGKKGKKKDPNMPKKAKTGFIFFSMKFRKEVRDTNPNMTIPETGKRLGAMWKELSDAEKAPFQRMHDDDKLRYEREMVVYKQNGRVPVPQPVYQDDDDDEEEESDSD